MFVFPVLGFRRVHMACLFGSFRFMVSGVSTLTYIVLLGPMCLILALVLVGCYTGRRRR